MNTAEHSTHVVKLTPVLGSRVLAEFAPQLQYEYETVLLAATHWLTDRVIARVARKADIPSQTLDQWVRAEWWQPLVSELREAHSPELDRAWSGLLFDTTEAVRDRVQNGEWHVGKGGEKINLPMRGIDAAKIMSIAFDKRQLLRRLPTSIRADEGKISKLAEALDQLMRQQEERVVSCDARDMGIPAGSDAITDVDSDGSAPTSASP